MGALGIFPRIFRHEAVGSMESVGEHVEGVKCGDMVIPVFLSNCQECIDCKSTKSNICSDQECYVLIHSLSICPLSRVWIMDTARLRISPRSKRRITTISQTIAGIWLLECLVYFYGPVLSRLVWCGPHMMWLSSSRYCSCYLSLRCKRVIIKMFL